MAKRKNQNPREYSLQHCKDRARERYGFELLDNDYDSLCRRLGEAVRREDSRLPVVNVEGPQSTFIVPLRGRKLVAVFDMQSGLLKTLLPPEQFQEHLS